MVCRSVLRTGFHLTLAVLRAGTDVVVLSMATGVFLLLLYFSLTANASICNQNTPPVLPCEPGFYCSNVIVGGGNQCISCTSGKYMDSQSTTVVSGCKLCKRGKYQDGVASTSCKECAEGQYGATMGGTTCTRCAKGRFSDLRGITSSTNCKACSAGRASNTAGAKTYEACQECPSGKYASSASTTCTKCSSLVPLTATGATSVANCATVCPSGTYLNGPGFCDVCESGAVLHDENGVHSCVECPAGKYSLNDFVLCANDNENCFCNGIIRRYHYQRPGYTHDVKTGYKFLHVMGNVKCDSALFGESNPVPSGGVNLACSCSTLNTACNDCEIGYYSAMAREEFCTSCKPGKYNTAKMQTSCMECDVGAVQPESGRSSCIDCTAGKAAVSGDKPCVECRGGKYTASNLEVACNQCAAGKYSNKNTKSTFCIDCPNGRKSPPQTSFTNEESSTLRCYNKCPKGSQVQNQQCESCSGGRYKNNRDDNVDCVACQPGMYNSDAGIYFRNHITCNLCAGGQYAAAPGSAQCTLCPAGYALPNSTLRKSHDNVEDCVACSTGKSTRGKAGAQFCKNCRVGLYAREGSAVCYDASGLIEDDTMYIAERLDVSATQHTNTADPLSFSAKKMLYTSLQISGCFVTPGGSHRNVSCPQKYDDTIDNIPNGYYAQWSDDRNFKSLLGSTKVDLQETFRFELQINLTGIEITKTTLHIRFASYDNERKEERGKWSLASTWKNVHDCDFTTEFLDTIGVNFHGENTNQAVVETLRPSTWNCKRCPTGSSCEGYVTWVEVRAKFGYWRFVDDKSENIQQRRVSFLECAVHEACLGAKNDDQAFKIDMPDKEDMQEGCNDKLGFAKKSRLCAVCAKGYHVMDTFGHCEKCPTVPAMVVSVVFSIFAVAALLAFITITTIKEVDVAKSQAEVIKRILLNYFQVVSLATTFPFKWPPIIRAMCNGAGIFSSIGESLISVDCIFRDYDKHTVFYVRQVMFVLLPAFSGVVLYGICKIFARRNDSSFASNTETPETTAKNYFAVSFNAFLFLLYPQSCKVLLSIFSCKLIGDAYYHSFDVSIKCYTGTYFYFMMCFGVPCTVIYIAGLPAAVFYFLRKHRARLDDRVVKLRWGIFYRGFRRPRFYWEVTVAIRKLLFVFLGVIQISLLLKAVFVLLATQIFIHLHITYEPYTKHNPILHRIEYWSLLVVFFTMCLGLLYSVPDGHCMGGRCFDIFASIIIVCLNLSFTTFCFRLYLTKYLQEHQYFKEKIPPWIWSTCVEMGKCFSGAKTRAWKLCSKASSNLFFNPSDRIKEEEEWVRVFESDQGRFYYSHDATCTVFWEYYDSNKSESIRKEGEKTPREAGWRRYWDMSSTWKANGAATSRWYFHHDERSLTKWAARNPEKHPSSKSMFALKNPLRALELIGRKSANKNPENPKKMKRPTMDLSWNRVYSAKHRAHYFTSPDGQLIKWQLPVKNEDLEGRLPSNGWLLYTEDKSSKEYFYNQKARISKWVYTP